MLSSGIRAVDHCIETVLSVAANPIRFSTTPALSPFTPPRLGEHNHLLALLARANPAT